MVYNHYSTTNEVKAGGIAGKNENSIEKSYSRGTVSVTVGGSSEDVYIGGISGVSTENDGAPSTIKYCAALNGGLSCSGEGSVTGDLMINRVAQINSATFTNNIANSTMSGTWTDKGSDRKDGADSINSPPAKNEYETLDWNFSTVWKWKDGYPVLQWQP